MCGGERRLAPTPFLFGNLEISMATSDAADSDAANVVVAPTDEQYAGDDQGVHPDPSKKLEIIVALVAIAFTGLMMYLSLNISLRLEEPPPGQLTARFWPAWLAGIGLALAVWRLIVVLVNSPDERDDLERIQPGGWGRLGITLALTIAYIAAWNVGSLHMFGYRIQLYPIITALFFMILVWIFGGRKWTALILYPVAMTAFIYFLFGSLLRIPL